MAPEFPKPKLKEISIQSEKWVSTPASPARLRDTSLLEFKAAATELSSSKLYWTDGTNYTYTLASSYSSAVRDPSLQLSLLVTNDQP